MFGLLSTYILPVQDLLFEQLLVAPQPPQQLLHRQLEVGVVGRVCQQVLGTNLLMLMTTLLLFPLSRFWLSTLLLLRIISGGEISILFDP